MTATGDERKLAGKIMCFRSAPIAVVLIGGAPPLT
jgi:hypothetical protein